MPAAASQMNGEERCRGIAGSPNMSGRALEKRLMLPISG
jgi:hypothetical protein